MHYIREFLWVGGSMPHHREIEQYANVLRQAKLGTECEPVGKTWVFRFLDRHRDVLQPHWSKPLDTQRANSLNPISVQSWFEVIKKFIVDAGIKPHNTYGMDESGCPLAYPGKERVVGARGTKMQHKQGGADRENVTALVAICADGSTTRVLLIFKGKNIKESWVTGNEINTFIAASDSHYTIEFIECARRHNIILLGYPAHCTHALQGLDVVCFAQFKEHWKREIAKWETQNFRPADKSIFTYLFSRAYLASFTTVTVKAAFRVTGIFPFDPTVISETQMKPSLTTSVKGTFPLPQPSPVRAVMAAMAKHPMGTTTPPYTPSLCRSYPEIDPDLYTPSKRIRALNTGLASTSSGSFLVSSDKLTSSTPVIPPVLEAVPSLPQPDWSLSRKSSNVSTVRDLQRENETLRAQRKRAETIDRVKDGIIEGCHATMVIQNCHLMKQNGALYAREARKTSNRTSTLDTSKGQVYSTEEVLADLRAQRVRKKQEAARKQAGRDLRAAKKAALARLEEEWTRLKDEHQKKLDEWKLTCEQLKADKIPRKDWPKAPTRPRKPTLPEDFVAVDNGNDDEEGGEDEETID
ncbi:hypothetical protein NMY22_g19492 [Coprinellus aureogranulatus]|nr:hypothetical protein NMY22_g19492 [Coprinellus aureogranulatus]